MRNIIIITKILSCILMCLSAYQSSSMIDESNNSILDSDTNVIVKSEFDRINHMNPLILNQMMSKKNFRNLFRQKRISQRRNIGNN